MFRRLSRDEKMEEVIEGLCVRQHHDVRVYRSFNLLCVSEPHFKDPLKIAVNLFSLSMEVKVHCMPCSVFGTRRCFWGNLLTNWRWEFRTSRQSRLKSRQTKPRRSRHCRRLLFTYNYKGSQTATLLIAIDVFMMLGKKYCASTSLMRMWCCFAQICIFF